MKLSSLLRSAAAFAFLTVAAPLMAHAVWIEPVADGQMGVRFAEPDGKVETSPGRLDAMTLPVACAVKDGAAAPVTTAKKSDHFSLDGAKADQSLCAEVTHTVMAPEGKPGRRPIFYARWHTSLTVAATPALTLDLVPTGKAGEVRVHFRGQPLGGVKATLYTEDADIELTADAQGFIRFEAAKAGQYLLTVGRHSEEAAGFHAGKPYAVTSHNASLAWRQP
jgi:hypothetical protein